MVLVVGGALITGALGAASARAAGPGCASDGSGVDDSAITVPLTITQTSTMSGLAPSVAPVPITGVIVNNGTDTAYVTAITVRITSVIKAPGAAAGPCGASDYVLLGARMPLGRTLEPEGSAAFGGASIGFWNKSINQDACQGAEIRLTYTSS